MSDEADNVSRLQPFGGSSGDGVKCTLPGGVLVVFFADLPQNRRA